uniref:Reverse transcriptase zinc-binding domain-containing protein n=1 Tax=Cannabis sativa TaxID=3483 RepID=A0A803P9H2_CANSA
MFQAAWSVAWSSICQPKAAGGLGIKNLEVWNKAAICNKLFLPSSTRLYWCKEAWSRLNTPKHSVIAWLAMLNRLKNQDGLLRVAGQSLQEVKNLVDCHAQTSNLQHLFRLIGRSKLSKFKKDVLAAAVVGLVYNLWRARNEAIWQKSRVNPSRIVEETKWTLKIRIDRVMPKKIKSIDRDWFIAL